MLAFGVYPETTLKAARDKRDSARKLLADGPCQCPDHTTLRYAHLADSSLRQASSAVGAVVGQRVTANAVTTDRSAAV